MQAFEGLVVVERVLSQMEGGCIFAARQSDGEPIRVKFLGRDTRPLPGDWFTVKGILSPHRDRFGRLVQQVASNQMTRAVTKGLLLTPWLERLPNIGGIRAARLVEAFGHELPDVLKDLQKLPDVAAALEPSKPALAAKIAAQLYARFAEQAGADAVKAEEVAFLAFLERLGIEQSRVASQLWRLMAGVGAADRLRKNPYVAASLVDWRLADRVGQRLLRDVNPAADLVNHPARLEGALSSVWRDILSSGDTAVSFDRLAGLLESRNVSSSRALQLAEDRHLLRISGSLARVPGAAWLEDQVTLAIGSIEARSPELEIPEGDALARFVFDAECQVGMNLTDEQRAAVAMCLSLPVAALQGGAGVGKTTVMKVLALAWERLGGDVVMGALAGKAALTLARGASTREVPRLAYTLARLIGMLERQRANEADPGVKRPAGDVTFTSKTLFIVDEAGMLDTPSLHKLLSLLPQGTRLLFAGDQGQLPPVGVGKFFHDLVGEGSRVASLTKVLRQASDSAIPHIAAQVRNGITPLLEEWRGEPKGVYRVAPADVLAVQRRLRSEGELMVVAAKRATVSSINESEAAFRRGPTTRTRRLGPLATVALSDPVVMTSNRYQEGLFNGLLGVVAALDGDEIVVQWDGESVARPVSKEAEGYVELAYAITCHKAQGSSSDSVLVVIEDSALVTREWLYTAITRGKELVLLVCDESGLERTIQRRTERITGLELPPRLSRQRSESMVRASP